MVSVPFNPDTAPSEYTGRFLVLMDTDRQADAVGALVANVHTDNVVHAFEFDGSSPEDAVIVFDQLGVAVVPAGEAISQAFSMQEMSANGILAMEPEQYVYAIAVLAGISDGYLHGYRDGVDGLVSKMLESSTASAPATAQAPLGADESNATWGLQATQVLASRYTGAGIRVAVLDTGIDQQHPDFAGRQITAASFVTGQDSQDRHGHGTHCIGTACGSRQPGRLPRYGVACEAEIFSGKVLDDSGGGTDGQILAGIEWALTNRCDVISMSLGARTFPGASFSPIYEQVARRALAAGSLIVAAAGNDSRRPGQTAPVSRPANSPSIMAVAALDQDLSPSFFSNAGVNLNGGQIDIAAPGRDVISSYPQPTLYRALSGTSMATPHVAGIAALLAEANPGVRGGALGWLLLGYSQRLSSPATDVGIGLSQAPV